MDKNKIVSLSLPTETNYMLEDICRDQRISKSSFVKTLLEKYYEKNYSNEWREILINFSKGK